MFSWSGREALKKKKEGKKGFSLTLNCPSRREEGERKKSSRGGGGCGFVWPRGEGLHGIFVGRWEGGRPGEVGEEFFFSRGWGGRNYRGKKKSRADNDLLRAGGGGEKKVDSKKKVARLHFLGGGGGPGN